MEQTSPESVEIAGRALSCQVCGNGTFGRREALLRGGAATFFGVELNS